MKTAKTIQLAAVGVLAAAVLSIPSGSGTNTATATAVGTITATGFTSKVLAEKLNYNVYLPAGYDESKDRYPVIYLLHGRGDTMSAWTQVKSDLDSMIAAGEIPPTIAIMPDAPWSSAANYYVDSAYKGAVPGRPVESAFITDLIPHVDKTYRTIATRTGRAIAGYSMGGYGAMRYSLAYPKLFAASIVLSPADYTPLPPTGSSAREFGAYGKGKKLFVPAIYKSLNYPALFPSFIKTKLTTHMFIAAGDDEYKEPDPKDVDHDIDFEAHKLYNAAIRVPGISAQLRIVNGGHDWGTWEPTFVEGAKYIFKYLGDAPAGPMKASLIGTTAADRAGGVATDADGNLYHAIAVGGTLDGQPYAGDLDVALVKYSPSGQKLWTRELGTSATERAYGVAIDASGNAVVTGYTKGNLDDKHPGNVADDAFLARYNPSGQRVWLVQFGAADVADRGYGVAVDSDGASYVTGYTKGSLQGASAGDKDVFLAKYDAAGAQVWVRQLGSAAEDKAYGVAVSGDGIYVGGMTAGSLGTSVGSTDGFIAKFDPAGNQQWLKQFGTAAADEVWAVAADAQGNAYIAGYSAGSFAAPLAGDKDMITARFDSSGAQIWKDQLGTTGNDKAAAVDVDESGNFYVGGFTDGALQTSIGKFDAVLVKYTAQGRAWITQFGTTEDDGADEFAEANLFLNVSRNLIHLSGLTLGDVQGQAGSGNGDVFLTTFDADGAPA